MSQAQNRSSSIAGAKPPAVVHCETNYDAIKVGASDKSRPNTTLLMALIDLAMIGRLGNKAVAALGLAVFSNTFVLASVEGLTSSVPGHCCS